MSELLAAEKYFTYEEWIQLPDNDRTELIDGIVYMMSEPSRMHQKISGEIFRQLANFLLDKPCDVYSAPFGVRLSQDEDTLYLKMGFMSKQDFPKQILLPYKPFQDAKLV